MGTFMKGYLYTYILHTYSASMPSGKPCLAFGRLRYSPGKSSSSPNSNSRSKPSGKTFTRDQTSQKSWEEQRKKAICHWCKEKVHYQRQCSEYIQYHLSFLKSRGIEVLDSDLQKTAMEIAALGNGTFVPDDAPYPSPELHDHLACLFGDDSDEDPEDF